MRGAQMSEASDTLTERVYRQALALCIASAALQVDNLVLDCNHCCKSRFYIITCERSVAGHDLAGVQAFDPNGRRRLRMHSHTAGQARPALRAVLAAAAERAEAAPAVHSGAHPGERGHAASGQPGRLSCQQVCRPGGDRQPSAAAAGCQRDRYGHCQHCSTTAYHARRGQAGGAGPLSDHSFPGPVAACRPSHREGVPLVQWLPQAVAWPC